MRRQEAFLDPVFCPDLLLDLAPSAQHVLAALRGALPDGEEAPEASILDEVRPEAPTMTPLLAWRTSRWDGQRRRFDIDPRGLSTLFVDVGAHEWSRFLPRLREDPAAILVCVEPTRQAFLGLYRRLKMDYADLLPRVVLLPMALTREPRVLWGFRTLHTNGFLQGECNSLLAPDEEVGHPCVEGGPRQIVPAMSLDALLGLLLGLPADDAAALGLEATPGEALGADAPRPAVVELKIDAQGADIDIVEALRDSPLLLAQVRDVQLEVNAPIYKGQPLRGQVLERMRGLGFALRWDLESVVDAGEHQVVRGCTLVAPEPRTEDCFFRRAEASPHTAMLDLVLRRPFDALRGGEGLELSTSRQWSLKALAHLESCDLRQSSFALQCLGEASGGLILNLLGALCGVWYCEPAEGEGGGAAAARVLAFAWPWLQLDGWEETHDAGAALLLFTTVVEALCRTFPGLCQPGAEDAGAAADACASLRGCYEAFVAEASDVVAALARPAHFLRLFRTAQRLAAPACAPGGWNLELARGAAGPLPTVLTSDYNHYVTAVAVDSSACAVDVSVAVWTPHADHWEAYHYEIWERNGRVRPAKALDVRMATEGEDWTFDCVFALPGPPPREVRTTGETVSFGLLQEMLRVVGAPVLSVRCAPPPAELLGPAPPAPPTGVTLVRSARAHLEMPDLHGFAVPLRPFARAPVRAALCTQQAWGFRELEQRAPGHAEFWFRYHVDVLGVDEVYFYDLDGSFEDAPFVADLRRRGRVIYDRAFGSVPPFPELFARFGLSTATAHFAQTLVQHHCWQQARHNADFVISVSHGWDMLLFSPRGEPLKDLLERLPGDQVTAVEGLRYGRGEEEEEALGDHPNVLGRFPSHVDPAARPGHAGLEHAGPPERVLIGPPRLVDGAVLSDFVPRADALLASGLGRGGAFAGKRMDKVNHLALDDWRANHYVQLFGNRGVLYSYEEAFPQLRAFAWRDAASAALGDELARRFGGEGGLGR